MEGIGRHSDMVYAGVIEITYCETIGDYGYGQKWHNLAGCLNNDSSKKIEMRRLRTLAQSPWRLFRDVNMARKYWLSGRWQSQ